MVALIKDELEFMANAFKAEPIKPITCPGCKREFSMFIIPGECTIYFPATGGCKECSNEYSSN